MTRAVSVLEVSEASVWDELEARLPLAEHIGESLGPLRRVALPSFERVAVPKLASLGAPVLLRWARRAHEAEDREELAAHIASLRFDVRRVLYQAQHHAMDGVVYAAWDPVADIVEVRALLGAGLMAPMLDDGPDGRYRLHPDLPPPPEPALDFSEAVMEETADLEAPRPGPLSLLHDMAALAAAIEHSQPRRTHGGTLARADCRKLATRLGHPLESGLEADPRWGRALRGLEGLGVVSMEPITRTLHLDLGLERTLAGEAADAVGGLLLRLVDADLHGVLPALRAALLAAGDGALDELIFLEILRDQHRELMYAPWRRDGKLSYPVIEGETPRPYDNAGFEVVETPQILGMLSRLSRLGVIRRAPGVFAATRDGRIWAGAEQVSAPPIWVSSDLEIAVPPDSVTPWERFQLERLGRCLHRDVVDRYRIERKGLETWLSTHDIDEAVALLKRRCPGLPVGVVDTLQGFARTAMRVVLVRGVVLE